MGNTMNRNQQAVVDNVPDLERGSDGSSRNSDGEIHGSKGDGTNETRSRDELTPLAQDCNASHHSQNSISGSFLAGAYNKMLFTALIVIIGAAATAAFLSIGITGAKQDQTLQFEQRAIELTKAIQTAWAEYQTFGLLIHKECHVHIDSSDRNINSTAATFKCTREEFRELYEYISSVGLEFQSAQYMPNVTNAQRPVVEQEAKEYYDTNYRGAVNYSGIMGFEADPNTGEVGLTQRSEQPYYFPVHFIEPVAGNERAIDLDLYSSSIQRKTLELAISTWKPALTDRLKLVQDTDPNAYSVILHHPGVPVSTHPNVDRPSGLSLMVVRIPDLLKRAALSGTEPKSVYVYDTTDPNTEPIFLGGTDVSADSQDNLKFVTKPPKDIESVRAEGDQFHSTQVTIADRQWTIAVIPLDGTFQPSILYVILGGTIILLCCVLLAVWYYTSMTRIAKMHQLRSRTEAEKAAIIVETARRQAISERELNDFIAHEVRNPLASAIAALSFVSSAVNESDEKSSACHLGENKTIREDLNIIESSLQFINELLRNMLDMHRAANKQMTIAMKPTDVLNDVFQPVAAMMHKRGNKGVEVILDCPKNLVVMTDPLRLKQMTLNLANNSLKFVQKGFIRLRADVVDGEVRIYLEDSGPGIPKEKQDFLFAKFQESLDLLNQGTGIGLNLCKQLASLMDGDIWLDEAYNSGVPGCVGSCFVVDLKQTPLESMLDASSAAGLGESSVKSSVNPSKSIPYHEDRGMFGVVSPENLIEELPERLSVLFVDDDLMIRKLFMRSMKRIAPDWHFEQAVNGETALLMAEEQHFDLIFVDQYMASVQKQLLGTETVRALRSTGCQAKICGLSANDVEEGFLDAGADYFLFKPFRCKKDALKEDILRFMNAVNPKRKKVTLVAMSA